jgi:murein tripeptide amidase MpaA
MYKKY